MNRQWTDSDNQVHEEADWMAVILWRKERLAEYLTKGAKLYVEGRSADALLGRQRAREAVYYRSDRGERDPVGRQRHWKWLGRARGVRTASEAGETIGKPTGRDTDCGRRSTGRGRTLFKTDVQSLSWQNLRGQPPAMAVMWFAAA
jgi:hypothetical protein